jgi:hypothetical protein
MTLVVASMPIMLPTAISTTQLYNISTTHVNSFEDVLAAIYWTTT